MKNNNWKKNKLGYVFLLSTVLLAACGGGDEKTTDTDSEAVTGAEAGTLQVASEARVVSVMESFAEDFEEETGISVEVVERDMFETLEALPLDGPAGLAPDVITAPYDRIGGLGQQGHLALADFPEDERFDETDKQQVSVDDEVYGVPFVIEALILYYNKDLLDEAPTTFAELEELSQDEAYAYPTEAGKNTAFLAHWIDFYNSYGLISGYDGYVFGKDGTDTSDIGLNTDGAIEGIEFAEEWYQQWPEGMLDTTSAGNFMDESFINGTSAAIMSGPWNASAYRESGVNFGAAAMPNLPNGNPYKPFSGGKGWVISQYTKNLDAAQLWLEFISREENMLAYYEETNEIPANQKAKASIVEAGEDELAIAVVEQYETSVPMPNIPEMAEVWTGAESMMFDAVSGNKTAKESADDSVQIIKDNIEQKY